MAYYVISLKIVQQWFTLDLKKSQYLQGLSPIHNCPIVQKRQKPIILTETP